MKAKNLHESIYLSLMLISFSILGLIAFQQTAPSIYSELTGMATARTTVNVTPLPPQNCDFTLYEDLNLVSLFCLSDFDDIDDVLENQTGLIGVFSYDKGSSDPWDSYLANKPGYVVNDLTFLTKKKGYWIKMNETQNFFREGFISSSTSIPLTATYDLIGYTRNSSQNISQALQSINGSYSKVAGYNPVTDTFLVYIPGSGSNTLTEIEPYRGYWINATQSDTLVIS